MGSGTLIPLPILMISEMFLDAPKQLYFRSGWSLTYYECLRGGSAIFRWIYEKKLGVTAAPAHFRNLKFEFLSRVAARKN
jgi:hypothetical protein